MNNLLIIGVIFALTTLLTIWLFYKAAGNSVFVLKILAIWILIQSCISLTGFYQIRDSIPPRFILLIGPGLLLPLALFLFKSGRAFLDSLKIETLTILHIVRIPVEICLYFICMAGLVPVLMTFEGYNYDLFSGVSAPFVFYLIYKSRKMSRRALLVWNIICLGLLINVLVIAILSAQTPFQRLAFDQPNIGVTFFPFVWLPSVIVPIVFLSHLSAIKQLINRNNDMPISYK